MVDRLCSICNSANSKYVCPRCNILYCSVECYRSEMHLQCSEAFYKENVMEYMCDVKQSPEEVKKMKDILKSIYEQDVDEVDEDDEMLDSDDELDISERLGAVCLDDADAVWEQLTESEKNEFISLVESGNTVNLIPLWDPWWNYRKQKKMVEFIRETTEGEHDYKKNCPALKHVPPLNQIPSRPPSPFVKWNIINALASYCYIMRFFNGQPLDFCNEAVSLLVSLSGNLQANKNYEEYNTAVGDVTYEVQQRAWLDSSEGMLSTIRDDVQKILFGPEDNNPSFYLQAALSDIYNLLHQAKSYKPGNLKKRKSEFQKKITDAKPEPEVSKEKLKLCLKKVEYFLSWAKPFSEVGV